MHYFFIHSLLPVCTMCSHSRWLAFHSMDHGAPVPQGIETIIKLEFFLSLISVASLLLFEILQPTSGLIWIEFWEVRTFSDVHVLILNSYKIQACPYKLETYTDKPVSPQIVSRLNNAKEFCATVLRHNAMLLLLYRQATCWNGYSDWYCTKTTYTGKVVSQHAKTRQHAGGKSSWK